MARLIARISFIVALVALLTPFQSANASTRERYIRRIVVTHVDAPVPEPGADWEEVDSRGKLNDILSLMTPEWRNLWFPVEYSPSALSADTAAIRNYYRNLGYLEARVVSAGTEPAGSPDDRLRMVDVIIVVDGIDDSVRYRLGAVRFDGVSALDTVDLRRDFIAKHIGSERWFSPDRAASNIIDLGIRYANAGYLDTASVRISQTIQKNPEDRSVIERYTVKERTRYRVEGYRIAADRPVNLHESVISDALADAGLARGNLLSRSRIVKAENNLLNLRITRMAQVYPDTVLNPGASFESGGDSVGSRLVMVRVAERTPGEIHGAFGFSDVSGWRVKEAVYYHNFLRQAKTIGQEAEVAVEPTRFALDELRFALLYGQPRIGVPRWSPVAAGYGTRVAMDHRLQALWEDHDVTVTTADTIGTGGVVSVTDEIRTRRISWTVGFSRSIGASTRAGVSYRYSRTDSVDALFGSGANTRYDHTLILRGSYDTRVNFLRPVNAVVLSGQVALSNLDLSEGTLTARPEVNVQYYRKLARDIVGAVSLSSGLYHVGSTADYTIPDLFWRSSQTPVVRGLRRNDLTTITRTVGNADTTMIVEAGVPAMAYAMGRFEVRLDPWERIGFAFFTDVAQAWVGNFESRISTITDEQGNQTVAAGFDIGTLRGAGLDAIDRANLGASVGFGPRIYWALPIRVDFAFPVRSGRGWKIEIGIGQAF